MQQNKGLVIGISIALVAIILGGVVTLIILLRGESWGGTKSYDYVSDQTQAFVQLDAVYNAQDLMKWILPQLNSFMPSEVKSQDIPDLSFLNLSGFILIQSASIPTENVFGIELSHRVNSKKAFDDFIKRTSSFGITFLTDGDFYKIDNVETDFFVKLDRDYVLLSQKKESIKKAIAIRENQIPSVTKSIYWIEIKEAMGNGKMMFFYKTPEPNFVTIAGGSYEGKDGMGIKGRIIGGITRIREQLKGPALQAFETLVAGQHDLSPIISSLPDSTVRIALAACITAFPPKEGGPSQYTLTKGSTAAYLDLKDDGKIEFTMICKGSYEAVKALLEGIYPPKTYIYKDVPGGSKVVYALLVGEDNKIVISEEKPIYFKLSDGQLILSNNPDGLKLQVPGKMEKVGKNMLSAVFDYIELFETFKGFGLLPSQIDMIQELLRQAKLQIGFNFGIESEYVNFNLYINRDDAVFRNFIR